MAFLPGVGDTSIGQALIRIGADTRAVKTQMAEMNAQMQTQLAATGQGIERQTSGWSKAFGAVKLGFIGLGIGLAAFTVDAIKTNAAFERSMAKVYALTGASKKQMEDLNTEVLSLATRVPQSPDKLAQGLYYVISAGFQAKDALKVLEVAAKDAAVGLTDTQTVADGLTSAMNAYGYSADKAAHVSDILTSAVTAGKMEWSQLAGSIGAAAVQGATAGVSLDQVTSAIATMTRSGLSAQRSSMGVATLMRALENPTSAARKEMAALGIKYDENTLKSKGLLATLQLLSDGAGKHAEVVVRLKNGQIDLAKSVDATAKANKGWAANLQTMTGNARGFLAAQIILHDGAKSFKEIDAAALHASDGIGATADSFNKMKEADPGLMFDLLKNRIQVMAITFGQVLMPKLGAFVGFLADAIPKAFEDIAAVWNSTLGPAVGEMVGAFGNLASTIIGIFVPASGQTGGDKFKAVLSGIASVVAQLARDLGAVATALTGLFSNPVVQGLTRILALFVAVRVALSATRALAGGLGSMAMGAASTLTGGFIRNPAAAGAPATAGEAIAKGGADAGAAMAKGGQEAGQALVRGAKEAALTGPVASASPYLARGPLALAEGEGASVALASEEAAIQRAAYGNMNSLTKSYVAGMAQPMASGERALWHDQMANTGATFFKNTANDVVGGIKGAAGTVKAAGAAAIEKSRSILSSGLSTVTKLFFPLMIADLVAEMAKAPIGDYISANTSFKRVGAQMKQDFFGGLLSLIQASGTGSDLFVTTPTLGIGNKHLDTGTMGAFNLSPEQEAALQKGGLQGALTGLDIAPAAQAALQRHKDESVESWAFRVSKQLEANGLSTADIDKALSAYKGSTDILGELTHLGGRAPAEQAALDKLTGVLNDAMNTTVGSLVGDAQTAVNKAVILGVQQATNGKVGVGQLSALPQSTYNALAQLLLHQATLDPRVFGLALGRLLAGTPAGKPITVPKGTTDMELRRGAMGGPNGPFTQPTKLGTEGEALQKERQRLVDFTTSLGAAQQTLLDTFANTPDPQTGLTPTLDAIANYRKSLQAASDADRQSNLDALKYLQDSTAGLEKLTGNAKHQQAQKASRAAVLKDINAKLGLTGGAAMSWTDLINWKASLSESTGTTAMNNLTARLKVWSAKAASAAAPAAASAFMTDWGAELAKAQTSPAAMEAFRKKLHSLIPKDPNFESKTAFGKWLKGVQAAAFEQTHGAMADRANKGLTDAIPGHPGKEADDKVASWMSSTAQSGVDAAQKDLRTAGYNMVDYINAGIRSNALDTSIIKDWLANFPHSPVAKGPMKHPYLLDIGRNMVDQIGQGIGRAGGLRVPGLDVGRLASAAATGRAGGGQHIYVDHMHIQSHPDEQAILDTLGFMAPGGIS